MNPAGHTRRNLAICIAERLNYWPETGDVRRTPKGNP